LSRFDQRPILYPATFSWQNKKIEEQVLALEQAADGKPANAEPESKGNNNVSKPALSEIVDHGSVLGVDAD
jgi:hypothetical protein